MLKWFLPKQGKIHTKFTKWIWLRYIKNDKTWQYIKFDNTWRLISFIVRHFSFSFFLRKQAVKVTEHLWVLILPKIFLLVSMKALDYSSTIWPSLDEKCWKLAELFNKIHFACNKKNIENVIFKFNFLYWFLNELCSCGF
jgi:hypothetical protein